MDIISSTKLGITISPTQAQAINNPIEQSERFSMQKISDCYFTSL